MSEVRSAPSSEAGASSTALADEYCARFAAAWIAGERPRIEAFLADLPAPARAVLLPRLIALDVAHRTPTVIALAQAAYDERQLPSGELDLHRLAVLADALEEVGAAGELVEHLRSPSPHVRGCHVIDLCLGLT